MKKTVSFVCFLLSLIFLVSCTVTPADPTDSSGAESHGTESSGTESEDTEKRPVPDKTVYNIGSSRQVFWDDTIVDPALTDTVLTLNHPTQQEIVYVTDAPWEGDSCDYYSLITVTREDGSQFYRMYYNGWNMDDVLEVGCSAIVICAIESEDGIHWTRPDYGLHAYNGDPHTNIVMKTDVGFDNFFVFVDTNPNCPANEKYKAVSEYLEPEDYGALHGYVSADGLHWTEIGQLRIPSQGTFDSVNTCFYNNIDGKYYLYYRGFHGYDKNGKIVIFSDPNKNTVRDVRMSVSKSFDDIFVISPTVLLEYADEYDFALYTNNVMPYYRAPQVYIGFPTRYNDHDVTWSETMQYWPDYEARYARYLKDRRTATTVTDTLFMTSRDGVHFDRFTGAWYTPGAEHTGNWIYGDGYFAYGMIETPTEFETQDKELSMFTFEGKFGTGPSRLYRYTTRIDGFASHKTQSYDLCTLTTRLFTFEGSKMLLNFKTSGAGGIVIDILDEEGNEIEGYSSYEIIGDRVDREITFGLGDLSALNGTPVRLRFRMRDAEVFSFKFE